MATPDGWIWASLADVVESIASGQSPNCESRPAREDEWGILKTTAITWERGWSEDENKAILPGHTPRPDLEVRQGDVLITKAGPVGRVGVTAFVDRTRPRLMVSGKMTRIRAQRESCAPAFLARALAAHPAQAHLLQRTTGMALSQTNFTHDALLKCPLLLPPLPEQRKIAAILSSVDETIEQTEAVIDQLRVVKKAMMAELLTRGMPGRHTRFKQTEIGEIPEGWEVVSLEALAAVITKGTTPTTAGYEYTLEGVPFIRVENISEDGILDLRGVKHISRSAHNALGRSQLVPGDVLISIAGALGRTAVVPPCLPEANTNQAVALVRLTDVCDGPFIEMALRGPQVLSQIDLQRAGLAQANLNLAQIGGLRVPWPSADERADVVAALHAARQRVLRERESLVALTTCKAALSHALLSGDLRVTTDEAPR